VFTLPKYKSLCNNPVPGNKSVPFWYLWPKISQVRICSRYRIVGETRNQLYCNLQLGKWQARQHLLSAGSTVHKSRVECFNCTSFCICQWLKGRHILALEAVLLNVTIIPSITLCPYSESTFARGRPDVQSILGTI